MNPKRTIHINPMLEGHPEPFSEPRTIPTGWDLSEILPPGQKAELAKKCLDELWLFSEDADLPQDSTL